MDINISKATLIEMGRKFRAKYLVEQAGYTYGIAAAEGEALSDLLPEGFLGETRSVLDQVNSTRSDKALMAEESKDATSVQNNAVKSAKVWRRKTNRRATRATRFGHAMPDGLLKIGRVTTVPGLAEQVAEMVALFEQNLDAMPGKAPQALLDQGKAIVVKLLTADSDQEVKRNKDLPASARDFYEKKGLLYLFLKAINDAGQELYAEDANASGRFNLHILYRRGTSRKPKENPSEG